MDSVSVNYSEQKNSSARIIVSLTTYPARIDRVHKTIDTLIRQTVKADMIVLWLAEEQFPEREASLPAQLLAQKEQGLHIEWCSDIKSYKKIIPAAEKWPEDIIITADDDIIYELNTIERLLESYRKHPNCVSTLRTHLMIFDEDGMPLPYDDWKPEYSGFIDQPLMALFPTTGAGTLFPPGILPEEAFDRDTFMSICPKADDVWIKCMLTLAGVPVVLADANTKLQYVDGTQQETLYSYNRTGNDNQLRAVIEKYNDIGGEEVPDDTLIIRMNDLFDYTPDDSLCQKYRKGRSYVNEKLGVKVSIILTGHNAERRFIRCLRSAQAQSLSEIEIICVSNGSTDGTVAALNAEAQNDPRIRIITLEDKVSPTAARRAAVLGSRGEYCLLPDINGMLAPDACEQLYIKAEEGDADILAFSRGLIDQISGKAESFFIGNEGRLRNRDILLHEFGENKIPAGKLSSCIFGGRLARKAYLHADAKPTDGDIYDYFLLCRCAEVYAGAQTQIYYASEKNSVITPADAKSSADAIEDFIGFARLEDQYIHLAQSVRLALSAGNVYEWITLPQEERDEYFAQLLEVWNKADIAAGIAAEYENNGERVLRELSECRQPAQQDAKLEKIGVVVTSKESARELFIMTELLDCIASEYSTVIIGLDKTDAAGTVMSAKCEYAGADLWDYESDNAIGFARRFESVLSETKPDALIIWAGSRNFVPVTVQANIHSIPVIAALTESVYSAMYSCSRPSAGLSALRLASVTVTDLPAQRRLLDSMGIYARYIPRPALRPMGGRSSGRASANAIVWSGQADDCRFRFSDAVEIFRNVRISIPDARMLVYLDGKFNSEQIETEMPEGVTVRRLRPDYGIFSDAAVQLVTGTAGTVSDTIRAGRTLGIPAVMYRIEGEQDSGAGAITVHTGDSAAAVQAAVRLLKDKDLRENLGAQAKTATGACSREEAARRWCDMLGEVKELSRRTARTPDDELGSTLCAAVTGYEDGAKHNADRLEEYRLRCEDYERRLEEAEQRRVRESEAHARALESARAQFRDERRAHTNTTLRLEEIESSTSYKAGSVLTYIPRSIKKFISRMLEKHSE